MLHMYMQVPYIPAHHKDETASLYNARDRMIFTDAAKPCVNYCQ